MANYSFDIVSEYDISEITNAVDQAKREINQRYDLKSTAAGLDFTDKTKESITLTGDADYQLTMVLDIVRKRFAARNLDQKILDTSSKPEQGNPWRWQVTFKKGIATDDAKKITKKIRDSFPKIKTQIQGEAVRVTGSSKDDLQSVMQLVSALDLDFPVQFNNYR